MQLQSHPAETYSLKCADQLKTRDANMGKLLFVTKNLQINMDFNQFPVEVYDYEFTCLSSW